MKKCFLCGFLLVLLILSAPLGYGTKTSKKIRAKNIETFDPGEWERGPVFEQRAPYEWPTSTPEAQRMDSMLVDNAIKEISLMPFLRSFLIIRNGHLVAERYFQGTEKTDTVHFRWAHGFLSTLVGIALKENYLQSVDQKMLDFFPEYVHAGLDQRKHNITIRNLLQLDSGLNFEERSETAWANWMASSDWVQHAIELSLLDTPGEAFSHNSPQPHILSALLSKATGMSTLQFAETTLFQPLGISISTWEQDPQGIYKGGWGMYFTPRDMARLGYLYLNNGQVDGQQILTPAWIQESTETHRTFGGRTNRPFENQEIEGWGYGYLWHTATSMDRSFHFQAGFGGQVIFNIPALNITVVTTANDDGTWQDHEDQFKDIYYFIIRYIPTLVWGDHEPPPYPPFNISGTRNMNRSLTQWEYVDTITWEPNPQNVGLNVTAYRIYMYTDEDEHLTWLGPLTKVFLGEVDAATGEYTYRDNLFDWQTPYNTYGVSVVTAEGKESIPAIITARENQ